MAADGLRKLTEFGQKHEIGVIVENHGGLSSEVSMAFGIRGLSHVVSTGCTSSTDAIFYAAQRQNDAARR